jgi:hypothetical protein
MNIICIFLSIIPFLFCKYKMVLNVCLMTALLQMKKRFLKNQMNGQFFEKMKLRQFLCIFNHGLRGKCLECEVSVHIYMLLVLSL